MLANLTWIHFVSFAITLSVVTAVGIYSGKKVKTSKDFTVGGRNSGSLLIAGAIMGTLVGGASTIGTAQLAYEYGLSAWWFTLGSGIACLILGLFLASPLRRLEVDTIPRILGNIYGVKARVYSALFCSVATFMSVVAQVLSAVALITALFAIDSKLAALIAVVLICTYVFFGGIWGTGLVGIIKLILLYFAMVISGALVLKMTGGPRVLLETFPTNPWFNLLGRGAKTDLGAAFSMLVGVVSTQTYLQAIFSAKNEVVAKKGAFISAIFIPPIGVAGILVGLFMRMNHPGIPSSITLPLFVMEYLPPWLAGIIFGVLIITIVAAGAGLSLGVSTLIKEDVMYPVLKKLEDKKALLYHRIITLATAALTLLFVSGNLKSLIMQWSFLSMGIRGATIFFPLLGALFAKDLITPRAGTAAIIISPLMVLIWKVIFPKGLDPLFAGLAISFIIILYSLAINRREKSQQ
jgi:SSS family solute:Na+ symporter